MRNNLIWVPVLAATTAVYAAPRADFAQKTYVIKRSRLLTEPTAYGEGIALLVEGVEVEVLEYTTAARWIRIRTPNGREGWIPVKATALAGRRDKPLISQKTQQSSSREPASVDEANADPTAAATLDTKLPVEKPGQTPGNVFAVEASYLNQVNRAQTSGVGGMLSYEFSLGPVSIGPAFGAQYFHESATNTAAAARVTRNNFKMQPGIALAHRPVVTGFTITTFAGLDIDHTAIRTVDTNSGQEIETAGGARVTGSETSFGIAAAIEPGFQFGFSNGGALSLTLNYRLSYGFGSGSGDFLGSGTESALVHALGAGVSYISRF